MFTLTDTVEYKHLVPGKEYTVKGILMDKTTGEPFLQNGEQITSEAILDRKSTRLNSSHSDRSRMPSSA